MKYILFLLVIFFTSCGSFQKFCCSKCDIQNSDSTYVTRDTITVRDTVPIPYKVINWDTVFDFSLCPQIHRVVKDKGLTGTLVIDKGKVSFKCESDSLKFVIETQKEIINTFNKKIETKWLPCDKEHPTKWNIYFRYSGYVLHILILIYFIVWIAKKLFH